MQIYPNALLLIPNLQNAAEDGFKNPICFEEEFASSILKSQVFLFLKIIWITFNNHLFRVLSLLETALLERREKLRLSYLFAKICSPNNFC